ncbi:glutaredoxin [Flagelloscypha sp. PMI_526]|nr:glutaredoxin [Flagelloscypha sp. PMI_526]
MVASASTNSHPPNYHVVTSPDHFKEILSKDLNRISLISFWAPWAEPCKTMNEVVLELSKKFGGDNESEGILVLEVEAEEQGDIAESFDIESVPSFLILRGHTLLDRIVGADAQRLTQSLEKLTAKPAVIPLSSTSQAPRVAAGFASAPDEESNETPEALEMRMKNLMTSHKVMLFMKGNPAAPRCGFSRKIVALLQDHSIDFSSFDILEDEAVRQGLKKLNDWPTFPQLIINGEFVGGLDIVKEMAENGELDEMVKA